MSLRNVEIQMLFTSSSARYCNGCESLPNRRTSSPLLSGRPFLIQKCVCPGLTRGCVAGQRQDVWMKTSGNWPLYTSSISLVGRMFCNDQMEGLQALVVLCEERPIERQPGMYTHTYTHMFCNTRKLYSENKFWFSIYLFVSV